MADLKRSYAMKKINANKAVDSRLLSGSVTLPVSYGLFSKSIKNLPDIAFQIQCQQLQIGITKSLDECAKWYYEAFYVDPSVRQKYDFRLNASTLKIREKILSLPIATPEINISPESGREEKEVDITQDTVTITVDDYGIFVFPVSFVTFTKYLNQKKLTLFLISNENKGKEELEILLSDTNACRLYLYEFYNKFYIFPNERPKKLYFNKVKPYILKELLKPGCAVDERAKTTMAKNKKRGQQNYEKEKNECIQNVPITAKTKESSSIVTFAVFENHVKNLYDIVWKLKLIEPNYMSKGFDDCAELFYLAFYQTPEIREKYPIELKNCTNALRDQIFTIPSKDEANELDKQFCRGQLVTANTHELELNKVPQINLHNNVESIYSVEVDLGRPGRFIFPISINVFRYFINYADIIEPLLRFNNNNDDSQESRMKCFKRYYNSFYVYAEKRDVVQYKFQNASKEMLKILFSFAQPLEEKAEKTMRNKYLAKQIPIVKIVYPVSFKLFQKFIKNLNEIVQQMMKCGEFEYLPNSRECYEREYYKLFYGSPQVRKRFPYELAPCPATIKTKLLKLPANSSEATINEEPVVRTINGLIYEYPVSLRTMVKYINYKELIKQLRDAHEKDKSLNGGPSYTDAQLIKKYYNFFYLNVEMRRMFKYHFDAPSNKMRDKLLAFARPINANQRKHEQNNVNKTLSNDTVVDCGKLGRFRLPVSIDTFKKYINYEEISNCLRLQNSQDESELSKIDQTDDILSCKHFRHYYLSFYIFPNIRDNYKYKFDSSDLQTLENLLSLAKPLNEQAEKTLQAYKCSKEKLISSETEKLNAFPVTFKTFQQYIVNFAEIVNEMQLCDKYKDKTEDECYQEYYKEFYSSMGIRKKFEYILKPCPLKMKQKLLSFCVLPPTKVSRNTVDRCDSDTILEVEKHGTFKYPVSFETFKSCINYAEIYRAIVSDSSTDKALLANPDNPKCLKMFLHYYYYFYLFPKTRKQYSYYFNCPNQELLKKISSYAQPLDERAKQTIDGAFKSNAKKTISDNVRRNVELESCAKPVPTKVISKPVVQPNDPCTLNEAETIHVAVPVSFNIFESLLHLDEVVDQMQTNTQHAQLSREECAMAYYHAFYYYPFIRDKYICKMKPCPADLKIKLLSIPETRRVLERDNCQSRFTKAQSLVNVAELHTTRKAQLASKTKIKFGIYNPLPPIIRKEVSSLTEAMDEHPSEEPNKTGDSTLKVCNRSLKSRNEISFASPLNTAATTLNVTGTLSTNANNSEDATGSSMFSKKSSAPATTLDFPPKKTSNLVLNTSKNTETIVTQLHNGEQLNTAASKNSTMDDDMSTSKDMDIFTVQQVSTTSVASTTDTNATPSLHINQHSSAVFQRRKHRRSSLEEEAENTFFCFNGNEHNMRYLLCSSHGIQKTIWRIISQLSLEEFKTYTNIHNGESFYENESMLLRCYAHVINKGNWPLNLYIKLSTLHKLLLSKCVQYLNLQLGELSPKILHWKELMLHTNFDKITELIYWQRTKEAIDNVETLWNERMLLYAMCWQHNRWIQKVPNITDQNINECFAASVIMPSDIERYRSPPCMEKDNFDNETKQDGCNIAEAEQQNHGISICPHTQLNLSNFVDVGSQNDFSQPTETQNDPLLQTSIAIPTVETKLHSLLPIKQEPIRFLNHLQFTCDSNNSSDDFKCEIISPDEKIIVLDDEEDDAIFAKLRCFDHQQKEDKSPIASFSQSSNSLENQITETPKDDVLLVESSETHLKETSITKAQDSVEKPNKVNDGESSPQEIAVPEKKNGQKRRPIGKDKTTAKKPRLVNDYVPQVTHAFRALPLNAMVRVESAEYMDKRTDNTPQQQSPQMVVSEMSASQAFAMDDTLLKSSQLQDLLDPPKVTNSKVNKDDISVNRAGLKTPQIQTSTVVYRQLKSYIFIRSLTNTQTIEYGIDSLAVGQPYQRALIQGIRRTCYINGPLLQILFPRITSTLLVDLKFLLWAVEKYNWDFRDPSMQKNHDLRIRVLSVFMDVAPRFGHFRLNYVSDAFNWAACSLISIQDEEFENRQPVFDMVTHIRPQILDQVKELVNLL